MARMISILSATVSSNQLNGRRKIRRDERADRRNAREFGDRSNPGSFKADGHHGTAARGRFASEEADSGKHVGLGVNPEIAVECTLGKPLPGQRGATGDTADRRSEYISEKKFQYRVKIPRAETLFLAMHARSDKPADWSCSRLLRDDITLNILDQCGETAFVMRMNSRRTIALNKLHTMIVGSSKMLGSVEENFCIMGSSFTVYDEARRPLSNIYGPNVCGCCMYQEAQFQVISIDGTHQIASLMHQWDNVLHDYNLLITFPANTDIKFKSLLLGAAFLLVNITSFVARCSKIAVINVTFSRCAFRSICTLKN
ncbi:uncharacterized protein LOC108631192 isoform X2 [Ceratina calcarata]|uniref:Phospholipid scramblase n=1 Tax=Ceratina calcarata TaxID=156304 RepID=A0AAJ7SAK5_9HYME|nr:uncharacterized protein LOC108631192 isoform X2 [Ceratina calcarata]